MVFDNFIGVFDDVSTALSGEVSPFTTLLFFTIVILIYTVFVYFFSRFMARKNLFHLNLYQYNKSEHPFWVKFFAILFYVLEYIILLPVLIFLFFAVLAILLLMLANRIDVATILLISAAIVASVRATAYISPGMSVDLAKMVPFTLLALALTQPEFFSIKIFFERIAEVPSLLYVIPGYLIIIVAIEIIMRGLEFFASAIVPKKK